MLMHLFKKYVVWMVLSYVLAGILIYRVFIAPQNKTIEDCNAEKARIEYDYMKITSSPEFVRSLDRAVSTASARTRDFIWADAEPGIDAGLVFYNYVYGMSKKAAVELLHVLSSDGRSSARRTQKDNLYYTWNVKIAGGFPDVLYMINEIEYGRKFLAIEEINITRGRDADSIHTLYDVVFLGLKKDAVDGKSKTES